MDALEFEIGDGQFYVEFRSACAAHGVREALRIAASTWSQMKDVESVFDETRRIVDAPDEEVAVMAMLSCVSWKEGDEYGIGEQGGLTEDELAVLMSREVEIGKTL